MENESFTVWETVKLCIDEYKAGLQLMGLEGGKIGLYLYKSVWSYWRDPFLTSFQCNRSTVYCMDKKHSEVQPKLIWAILCVFHPKIVFLFPLMALKTTHVCKIHTWFKNCDCWSFISASLKMHCCTEQGLPHILHWKCIRKDLYIEEWLQRPMTQFWTNLELKRLVNSLISWTTEN